MQLFRSRKDWALYFGTDIEKLFGMEKPSLFVPPTKQESDNFVLVLLNSMGSIPFSYLPLCRGYQFWDVNQAGTRVSDFVQTHPKHTVGNQGELCVS